MGGVEQGFPVSVFARPEYVDPDSMALQAALSGPAGQRRAILLERDANANWRGELGELEGPHELRLTINGRTPAGQPLFVEAPVIAVAGREPPPAPAFDWLTLAWQVAAANAVALVITGAALWWRRRRRTGMDLQLAELES